MIHNIYLWHLSFWGSFETHMSSHCPFRQKKVSFSMVFSKLWPAQCTKWLENWHSYTLAQGLQDLLMTFCVLRPLAGTFGPKTNFRGQKMADPPIFNRSLWPQIWSNLKNFWAFYRFIPKLQLSLALFWALPWFSGWKKLKTKFLTFFEGLITRNHTVTLNAIFSKSPG